MRANEMANEIITRKEAKAKGLTKYFTGLPCKYGHIVDRQTANGVCISCRANIGAKYAAAHPEKMRDKHRNYEASLIGEKKERRLHKRKIANRKYASANPEKIADKSRKWHELNPEKRKENNRRWCAANKDKVAIKNRRYKTEHAAELAPMARQRAKEWNAAHPEDVTKRAHARRARKKNAPGSHTADELKALIIAQNYQCICGISLKSKKHLDHIVPLARGGSNGIENLQYLCPQCNLSKGAKDMVTWLQQKGLHHARLPKMGYPPSEPHQRNG